MEVALDPAPFRRRRGCDPAARRPEVANRGAEGGGQLLPDEDRPEPRGRRVEQVALLAQRGVTDDRRDRCALVDDLDDAPIGRCRQGGWLPRCVPPGLRIARKGVSHLEAGVAEHLGQPALQLLAIRGLRAVESQVPQRLRGKETPAEES